MMVCHLADVWTDVQTDAQMHLIKGHCRWQCKLQVKVHGDQTNKLSVESKRHEKHVVLVGPNGLGACPDCKRCGFEPHPALPLFLALGIICEKILFIISHLFYPFLAPHHLESAETLVPLGLTNSILLDLSCFPGYCRYKLRKFFTSSSKFYSSW